MLVPIAIGGLPIRSKATIDQSIVDFNKALEIDLKLAEVDNGRGYAYSSVRVMEVRVLHNT